MYDVFTPEENERFQVEMEAFNKSMETLKLELPVWSEDEAAFDRSILSLAAGSRAPAASTPPKPPTPALLVQPNESRSAFLIT